MTIKQILLLILIMSVISACSTIEVVQGQSQDAGGQIEVAQASTPTPIPTAAAADRTTFTVQRGTVSEEYVFRARWLPRDQINLAFEVSGDVRSVNVQRGDTVAIGDVIADLQIDNLETTLASQQINLDAAIRNLNDSGTTSDDGVVSAQFTLANENLNLQSQQIGLPWTSVNNAWLNVLAAQRAVENADRDYNDALSYSDTPASEVNRLLEDLISEEEALERAWNDYYS
ncbi:MAG: biotin/lipoyl-binding protein, partial [Chloroflexota bacterium]